MLSQHDIKLIRSELSKQKDDILAAVDQKLDTKLADSRTEILKEVDTKLAKLRKDISKDIGDILEEGAHKILDQHEKRLNKIEVQLGINPSTS